MAVLPNDYTLFQTISYGTNRTGFHSRRQGLGDILRSGIFGPVRTSAVPSNSIPSSQSLPPPTETPPPSQTQTDEPTTPTSTLTESTSSVETSSSMSGGASPTNNNNVSTTSVENGAGSITQAINTVIGTSNTVFTGITSNSSSSVLAKTTSQQLIIESKTITESTFITQTHITVASATHQNNTPVLAASITGAVVLISALIGAIACFRWRRASRRRSSEPPLPSPFALPHTPEEEEEEEDLAVVIPNKLQAERERELAYTNQSAESDDQSSGATSASGGRDEFPDDRNTSFGNGREWVRKWVVSTDNVVPRESVQGSILSNPPPSYKP